MVVDGKDYLSAGVKAHKGSFLLHLEEVANRNDAEKLIGCEIFGTDLPLELAKDTYHVNDLIGLSVETVEGKSLGKVTNVLNMPTDDLLEIGSLLLPFRKEFVKKLNLKESKITVKLLEGMLEEDAL